jgi:hypothetical protein
MYSYLGSKLQSSYEKYEKYIKTTNMAMKLKLFQKTIYSSPILPKKSMFYNNHVLAKNDHLRTIL